MILTSSFPDESDKTKGVFIYYRVQELINKGLDVEVWRMNSILKGFRKNYSLQINPDDRAIKVNILNSLKIPGTYIWFGYSNIKEIILKKGFNLIQIHFAWDSWLAHKLTRNLKIPYVITCHGSDIHTFPDKNRFFFKWTKMFFKSASGVIFVSEYLKTLAEKKGFTASRSIVIPNGINLEDFFLDESKKRDLRKILYIGNLFKIKGADLLPAIIRETIEKEPLSKFQIVGDGPMKINIMNELSTEIQNKQVMFSGAVSHNHIPEILRSAGVLIIPSRNEGFSIAAIEARACGVPVVAAKAGGLPSAVESGGLLVEPGANFESRFAHAIVYVMEKKWHRNKLSGDTEKFNRVATINDEISFYHKIISRVSGK